MHFQALIFSIKVSESQGMQKLEFFRKSLSLYKQNFTLALMYRLRDNEP